MSRNKSLVGLDVGEVRIGVALASTDVRIAVPFDTIEVDGTEIEKIAKIVIDENADTIVVGYPRNQSGDSTKQTEFVEQFAKGLEDFDAEIVFQDESLTSVLAEERLSKQRRSFTKGDIDSEAAAIILQDYLERN